MQRRNVLNSPRLLELKKHRRKIFLGKILLSMFAFLVIFAGFVYISLISVLNIGSIQILNNKSIDAETIKTVVQKEIAGNYLWFFPKTNVFFYPKNNIKKELLNQFKGIKDVSFSIKEKKNLEISIVERVALYTWCGNILPENNDSNQKCYFMDDSGYIFNEAPYFSGEVYFKFYGLNKLENDIPSPSYFSEQNFQELILFKETLESIKLKPVALYIQDDGDIKVFLSGGAKSTGPEIIFKVDSDFKKIAENLEAALTTEPLQSNFRDKYSSLLYIDLRIKNKVYYKFR